MKRWDDHEMENFLSSMHTDVFEFWPKPHHHQKQQRTKKRASESKRKRERELGQRGQMDFHETFATRGAIFLSLPFCLCWLQNTKDYHRKLWKQTPNNRYRKNRRSKRHNEHNCNAAQSVCVRERERNKCKWRDVPWSLVVFLMLIWLMLTLHDVCLNHINFLCPHVIRWSIMFLKRWLCY